MSDVTFHPAESCVPPKSDDDVDWEIIVRIERVESTCLRFEYADGFTYAGGKCSARVTSLVRVYTDTGQVGIGSAYSHPGMIHLTVDQQLAPLLVGLDASDVEALWERMYRITRWYGRKGAAMSALGAIDMALWDLRGKAAGKPLWELLGGTRPTCPAYASALLWKSPNELADEAAGHVARGFRRMKVRLGRGQPYDQDAVRAVRQAIGSNCDLMCDGSMRYDLATARALGEFLATQKVFWFEEPFEPENLDDYAALRGTIGVPLAAGENEFGLQGFRELVRCRAVDIIQPDASRCGGVTELLRAADLARQHGLRFAPHTWSDAVTVMANAQVVAARDHGLTVEIDQTGNPFIDDLLVEPLRVIDGQLQLSRAPGLGIELRDDIIARYRLPNPLEMPEGLYSDMVFGRDYYSG